MGKELGRNEDEPESLFGAETMTVSLTPFEKLRDCRLARGLDDFVTGSS